MLNVLSGAGNGAEKDAAWAWKTEAKDFGNEHQFGLLIERTAEKMELRELQAKDDRCRL